jgi:hypothetical protein
MSEQADLILMEVEDHMTKTVEVLRRDLQVFVLVELIQLYLIRFIFSIMVSIHH